MRIALRGLSWVILLASMLTGPTAVAQSYTVRTLPSGRQLKILRIGKINFTASTPALMLSYQTDISIDDKVALEREAEDIWSTFRLEVDKAGLVNAILSANEPPGPGFLSKSRGFNFVYKRASDGKWSR